ncbi:Copper-exporting P-type ATPase [bioreactor metagenome]|uniref:Copper-exporting P-type ATPase n=1 Tax=bioreactor metagenome TaxID=1076179 RepID=A0A644XU01_9ZZZZ
MPLGVQENDLLTLAAGVESASQHPLASAIVEAAKARKLPTADAPEKFENLPGRGLRAEAGGGTVLAGNRRLMEESGVDLTAMERDESRLAGRGQTPMYFARDGKLLGLISVADQVKATSTDAVAALKAQDIRTVLLTGDNQVAANAIAAQGGVDEVVAEVLPEEKAGVIRQLQSEGKIVMMVGDGINDAPALAQADVGCAIGNGSDIAVESAQVILMRGDLRDVARAIRLSRLTIRDIKQNLFWAFCYNTVGIPIAAGALFLSYGLLLSPMIAGAAMSLSSICVVTNALRLGRKKL